MVPNCATHHNSQYLLGFFKHILALQQGSEALSNKNSQKSAIVGEHSILDACRSPE